MTETTKELLIRPISADDCRRFPELFAAQGWTRQAALFEKYLQEQTAGLRFVRVAETAGTPCGYVTLVPLAKEGPFKGHLPEIVDFNVLEAWQGRGIGTALLDEIEQLAVEKLNAATISLGVGLHTGYGPAQRLYVKRGFAPDGSGVWYHNVPLTPYTDCRNDDDLVLYLSKSLA